VKANLILMSLFLCLLPLTTGCYSNSEVIGCDCNCPPPYDPQPGFGVRRPPYGDVYQRRSPDGTQLCYTDIENSGSFVLDLHTLHETQIEITAGLPPFSRVAGIGEPKWCPYDNDLLAVTVWLSVDTLNTGARFFAYKLYTYRLSTRETRNISPLGSGAYGFSYFQLLGWLPGSQPGRDRFRIAYSGPRDSLDGTGQEFYSPQTHAVWYIKGGINFAISKSGAHRVWGTIGSDNNFRVLYRQHADSLAVCGSPWRPSDLCEFFSKREVRCALRPTGRRYANRGISANPDL
jgi:hypothetical protein